jgi:type II secretory pathway component PulK
MASKPRFKLDGEKGIALFMVVAAMMILSVIVTEFTYVSQVNARATADSSDQIKAHYLAKTGLKVSLLRLRAYKDLRKMGKGDGAAKNLPQIPRAVLDPLWNIPFFYPIPTEIPGLTVVMRDEIKKFVDESALPGKFTATIESESGKIGLNSILPIMAPPSPTPTPGANPGGGGSTNPSQGQSRQKTREELEKEKQLAFSAEEARKGLREILARVFEEKVRVDQDFADQYRDLEIDELYDNILGWVDFSHQPKNSSGRQPLPYKRAPFYSITELHMVRPIDDGLYDLYAPLFTPYSTPGVNVNKIKEPMLRVLLPGITDEEVQEFFKFRDDPDVDNSFKKGDDFFKWASENVATLRSSTTLDDLKTSLSQQGIQILTDEELFKITVTAEVNKATRILEAWILISDAATAAQNPRTQGQGAGGQTPPQGQGGLDSISGSGSQTQPNAVGLRLLFMRES